MENISKGTIVTGGETCDAEPTCTGNPAECFSAKQLWKIQCNGKGSGTGTGDGNGPGGEGCADGDKPSCDAKDIQCNIVLQQWWARCKTKNLDGTELGSAVQGTDEKSAEKQKQNSSIFNLNLGERLNTQGFLNRSCPADMSFQVLDVQVVIPFSNICWALEFMGQVAYALALLIAARIVFV